MIDVAGSEGDVIEERSPVLVSICVATVGRPTLLRRALPSTVDAVASGAVEVVVAVDADRIDPEDVEGLATWGCRVVGHRGGPGPVRNAAVAAAVGEYVCFLDDDDELADRWWDVVGPIVRRGDVDIVSGTTVVVRGDAAPVPAPHQPMSSLHGRRRATFLAGTFVVRRSLFDDVGGYDERFSNSENWELAVRLIGAVDAGRASLAVVDDALLVQHPSRAPSDYPSRRVAELMLDKYAAELRGSRAARSTYEGQAGVGWMREGVPAAGRRAFARAVRLTPASGPAWARLMVSFVAPIARRRWPPYPADPR